MSSEGGAPRICLRPDCGKEYTGLTYHNRIFHQDNTTLRRDGKDIVIQRRRSSRDFTCPTCLIYSSNDPEGLRVRVISVVFLLLNPTYILETL
jgi:hypothetical protein